VLKTNEKREWTIRISQLVPVLHCIAVRLAWQENHSTALSPDYSDYRRSGFGETNHRGFERDEGHAKVEIRSQKPDTRRWKREERRRVAT
jgi:hypothetical protein